MPQDSNSSEEDRRLPLRSLTLSGKVVAGRYRVLERLGQGGIGRVYKAEQIGLDRVVAVKVIRPEKRQDSVTEERFVREAKAAGRISSPHVVTLFDCGRDGDELYIAMELLRGQSLRERLKDGPPIEAEEALDIAVAIVRGLVAAHEAGVLHRDLKPANVFLCADGNVKVLDFGIAKIVDEKRPEPLTDVKRVLGTPVYMSPEAAQKLPVEGPADLYGLGVMLYEMLVGSPPFRTGDALKTMRAHVHLPAPPLRQAAPWLMVPVELEGLVAEMLEKDPKKRPDSARSVLQRLEAIREHWEVDVTQLSRAEERGAIIGVPFTGDDKTEVWLRNPWESDSDFLVPADEPPRRLSAPEITGPQPLLRRDELLTTSESLPVKPSPQRHAELRAAAPGAAPKVSIFRRIASVSPLTVAVVAAALGILAFVAILVVRQYIF